MFDSKLIRSLRIATAALASLALVACDTSVQNAGADAPDGAMVVRANGVTYQVLPLRMKDGTECVVVASSRVALACDFSRKSHPIDAQ